MQVIVLSYCLLRLLWIAGRTMPHAQESAACQRARPASRPSPNSRSRWSYAPGSRAANSLLPRSYADRWRPGRSALASRTFYAEARMSCGLQLFGFVIVSMWQMRAYPRTLHSCNNWLLPPI